ncbi:MAG: tetratricopeptide repeat protein [Tannerellaceae bacterium]|jgi:signal transduction histidine kinase|nr:tetratricopeptide repeat protein [Tannerellaceae bacterium]
MKRIIIVILTLCSAVCGGQNIDSLKNVLETQKLTAEEKIRAYELLTAHYHFQNPREALRYAEKGFALAEKRNDDEYLYWFSCQIGTQYERLGIVDTAMVYLNRALDYTDHTKDSKSNKAYVYGNMANIHYRQNNKTLSLEYFLKAKVIADELNDKPLQLNALISIAGLHRSVFDHDKAVDYYGQATLIAEELKDTASLCDIYHGIGTVFSDKKDYDKAIEYDLKLIETAKSIAYSRFEALGMVALARTYCAEKFRDFTAALEYVNQALPILEKLGDPRLIAGTIELQSYIYLGLGRFKEAETTALKAMEIDSLETGIIKMNTLMRLIVANIHLGNKDRAVNYFTEYVDIVNQYNDKSFHETLTDMETRYETEKKETRIATLEWERRLYVWLGAAGILLMAALVVVLWQTRRNARREKQLIATRSVLDGEMNERSRLARDLHDRLSGNLSAVKIELNQHADSLKHVRDKLDGCIDEIRRAAHNLMPVSLQYGMKVAIEDFVSQFPEVHFHFFGSEKRIDERLEFMVYCCANELVTNSLRHSGAKNINVQLVQDDRDVTLTVSDDGCGFDEKNITKGIGLKNIRDRVASCNGKIDVTTSPGKGTETNIELSIKNA